MGWTIEAVWAHDLFWNRGQCISPSAPMPFLTWPASAALAHLLLLFCQAHAMGRQNEDETRLRQGRFTRAAGQ